MQPGAHIGIDGVIGGGYPEPRGIRAIPEQVGSLAVSWRSEARAVPEGWSRVDTDQPLGAIAVYLCEPESDDGAVENGLVAAPAAGQEYPIWRVV